MSEINWAEVAFYLFMYLAMLTLGFCAGALYVVDRVNRGDFGRFDWDERGHD